MTDALSAKNLSAEKDTLVNDLDVTDMVNTIEKLKLAVNNLSVHLEYCMQRKFKLSNIPNNCIKTNDSLLICL